GLGPGVGAKASKRLGVPYNSNSNSNLATATVGAPDGASKRGSRIPDDFTITPEMATWATDNLPGLDVNNLLDEFVDYWRGVAGSKGVKLDWIATWRNGMRKR